uniref:ATP-binding cassette domain-containing protein n=1 Tax=Persephonella sp. TaxID=2060922 RepID=UPI00262E72AF
MISKTKDREIPVLSVRNLKVSFHTDNQTIQALKGISFDLYRNEILALVGESGSGKSVTCYSILNLLPKYAKVSGKITFNSDEERYENLLELNKEKLRDIRGNKISMVFQEPSAVLNPLLKIGDQIIEAILAHNKISEEEAKKLALKAMEKARIPEVERRFNQYP